MDSVAFTGDYASLQGKPAIPTIVVDSDLSENSNNPISNKAVYNGLHTKADKKTTLAGYGISDAYTKSEIDILNTEQKQELDEIIEEQDRKIEALNGNDVIVVTELPSALEAENDKIYRLRGVDSYTDYMLNSTGDALVPIATYSFPGLDDEPVENSENPITSGGVAKIVNSETNNKHKFYLTDSYGGVIAVFTSDNILNLFYDFSAKVAKFNDIRINDKSVVIIDNQNKKEIQQVYCDDYDGILFAIDRQGKTFGFKNGKSIYDLNISKDAEMHTACNFYSSNKKRTQIISCTDTHETIEAFERFIEALGDFESPDCGIYLGDIINYDGAYQVKTMEHFSNLIRNARKPVYYLCGNHEAGQNRRAILGTTSQEQLYEWFIKPAVENHWLLYGEYDEQTNPKGEYIENKLYYCHEFADGTFLICLYPFDDGNVIASQTQNITLKDGTNVTDTVYWRPIAYSDSYELITAKNYVVGDRVNLNNYNLYSFECIEEVTIKKIRWGNSSVEDVDYYPRYKSIRANKWLSNMQLRWFCKKLEYAAEHNLTVLIAQHMPFSTKGIEITDSPFSMGGEANYKSNDNRYNDSNIDVIADIVDACMNKRPIDISLFPESTIRNGIIDNTTSIPGFRFIYDFSNSEGSLQKVFHLCGHYHTGGLYRHSTYNQKALVQDGGRTTVIDADPEMNNGIGKSLNQNNICFDRLNVFTILNEGIHVTRLGSEYTNRIIDNHLVSRDNVIIPF